MISSSNASLKSLKSIKSQDLNSVQFNNEVKVISDEQNEEKGEAVEQLSNMIKKEQIASDPETDTADERNNYRFKSRIKLRNDEQDYKLNQEVRMMEMAYSQHEFVKINEVGQLITEAVQGLLDKIHHKDLTTRANKNAIRSLDTKFKQIEQQVISLLKLNSQVKEHHKVMKDISFMFESDKIARDDQLKVFQQEFDMLATRVTEIENKNELFDGKLIQSNQNLDAFKQSLIESEERIKIAVLEVKSELLIDFKQQTINFRQLTGENELLLKNYRNIETTMHKITKKELDKIIDSIRVDSSRLIDMESSVRQVLSMNKRLQIIDDTVNSLVQQNGENREALLFNERALPLLIHLQASDLVSQIVQTDIQKQSLITYDRKKLKQINSYIQESEGLKTQLHTLRRRIIEFGRYLEELDQGAIAFNFGKYQDYTLVVKEQQLPTFNKMKSFVNLHEHQARQIAEFQDKLETKINNILDGVSESDQTAKPLDVLVPEQKVIQVNESEIKLIGQNVEDVEGLQSGCSLMSSRINSDYDLKIIKKTDTKQSSKKGKRREELKIVNHTHYVTNFDTHRLKYVEIRQKNFMRAANEQFALVVEDYEQRLEFLRDDQKYQADKSHTLEEIVTLLREHCTEPHPDRKNLIKRLAEHDKQLENLKKREEDLEKKFDNQEQRESKVVVKTGSIPMKENPKTEAKMNTILSELAESNKKIEQAQRNLLIATTKLEEMIEIKIEDLLQIQNQKITEAKTEIIENGKEIQEAILDRQSAVEQKCEESVETVKKAWYVTQELQELFNRDYTEFVRERKRWKSDFAQASNKATSNFDSIKNVLNSCLQQNQSNIQALKMVVDAQMIQQLCERQEVEDKKQIGLFGMQSGQQMLNPRAFSEDAPGKRLSSRQSPKRDSQKLRQQNQGTNESLVSDPEMEVSAMFSNHVNKEDQVLKVDRSCLSCSGNMNQVIHQLKLACLSFTQSPVPYKDKYYKVTDLLRVKANIIAECQRMIRDKIYNSEHYDGQESLRYKDERSFVIEPLLNVTSVNLNQTQEKSVIEVGQSVYQNDQIHSKMNSELDELNRASLQVPDMNYIRGVEPSTVMHSDAFESTIRQHQTTMMNDFDPFDPDKQNHLHKVSGAFSPFVPTQSSMTEQQRRAIKIRQKAGQILDSRNSTPSQFRSALSQYNQIVQSPPPLDIRVVGTSTNFANKYQSSTRTVQTRNDKIRNRTSVQFNEQFSRLQLSDREISKITDVSACRISQTQIGKREKLQSIAKLH